MKSRCDNPKNLGYVNYGGRGISYDPRWADFIVFARDIGEPPASEYTLDRIDNNKGYYIDNVRWATRYTQSRNTRQNIWVEINGVTKCLYDWCDIYNIKAGSVYRRLASGMDIITAITKPKAKRFLE
jgi:hypothetical protein